jgi:hypothetical protein
MKATLGLLLLSLGALQADDVIFMNNGDKRAGQLVSFDEKLIRLQVPLPAPSAPTPRRRSSTLPPPSSSPAA